MKGPSKKAKLQCLLDKVMLGDDGWQANLLTYVESISCKESKLREEEPLTRGQLIQQHGYEEATKKIESGRYRKEEDSDGDSIYMRVNKKHSKEASREKKQTLERSDTHKKSRKRNNVFT